MPQQHPAKQRAPKWIASPMSFTPSASSTSSASSTTAMSHTVTGSAAADTDFADGGGSSSPTCAPATTPSQSPAVSPALSPAVTTLSPAMSPVLSPMLTAVGSGARAVASGRSNMRGSVVEYLSRVVAASWWPRLTGLPVALPSGVAAFNTEEEVPDHGGVRVVSGVFTALGLRSDPSAQASVPAPDNATSTSDGVAPRISDTQVRLEGTRSRAPCLCAMVVGWCLTQQCITHFVVTKGVADLFPLCRTICRAS